MQVRGWELLAEPNGQGMEKCLRLGQPRGRIQTWPPQAPQSQLARGLNTREYLCSAGGKTREIATPCKLFARRFK